MAALVAFCPTLALGKSFHKKEKQKDWTCLLREVINTGTTLGATEGRGECLSLLEIFRWHVTVLFSHPNLSHA